MTLPSAIRSRRLLVLLAAACLALPAAPAFWRSIVHFYAGFDTALSQGPGGGQELPALGGKITLSGTPDVFTLEPDPTGGVLAIALNPLASPAVLLAELEDPAHESEIRVDFDLVQVGGPSGLVIGMIDDDSGGMIDIEFSDDGSITVGGVHGQLDQPAPNVTKEVSVVFRDSAVGPKTWKVSLKGPGGTKIYQGFVLSPGDLSLGEIRIVRPGLSLGGSWKLDELVVSSPVGSGSSSQ